VAGTTVRFGSELTYRTRNDWNLSLGIGAEQGTGQRTNAGAKRRSGWGSDATGGN